jgi:hypothetical protein
MMSFQKLIWVFLLFAVPSIGLGQTPEEVLGQLRAKEIELAELKAKNIDSNLDVKAFVTAISEKLVKQEEIEKVKSRLSSLIYRHVLKNGTDIEATQVLREKSYKGLKLTEPEVALKYLKGTELLALTYDLLQHPEARTFATIHLSDEIFEEIGRSFVRVGFTEESFRDFFEKWNTVSVQTEKWKFNEYYDRNFQRIVSGMLSEGRDLHSMARSEESVISQIVANFEDVSLKAKLAIISSLSKDYSPTAYLFLRTKLNSTQPEIRKSVLQVLHRVDSILATDDVIRMVRDIETGKISIDSDLASAIYNKVLSDLSRTSSRGDSDRFAVYKMRKLVFEFLDSTHAGLKANFQTFLKSSAFTDAEVDARIIAIAKDSKVSNRWSAPYIVNARQMNTVNAAAAMKLLLNETDIEVAQEANRALERILTHSMKVPPGLCKSALAR